MADVVAEERTTLPEGATLSLSRIQRPKLGACNELRAWMGDHIVKMRADDIAPQNLRWYLDQVVKVINRERVKLTKKPGLFIQTPKSIADFVNNMAFHGMFILDPVKGIAENIADKVIASEIDKSVKKAVRPRRRKTKAVTVPANGTNPI
jgi:hypothetical protein